jgi:hypothetical protein
MDIFYFTNATLNPLADMRTAETQQLMLRTENVMQN